MIGFVQVQRNLGVSLKLNPRSTQTHFIDLTVTKNSVAGAIMSAITQLYSLCMYFQNVNFNQTQLEGKDGGRSCRKGQSKFAEQMTEA